MKVAYFTALRELRILDEPKPVLTRPGDVLLRIDRVGVCGSDVHYYVNGRIANQLVEYPATLGHECAATVTEIGSDVRRLDVGDRVAVDPEPDTQGPYRDYFEGEVVPGVVLHVDRGGIETARNVGDKSYLEVIVELKDSP